MSKTVEEALQGLAKTLSGACKDADDDLSRSLANCTIDNRGQEREEPLDKTEAGGQSNLHAMGINGPIGPNDRTEMVAPTARPRMHEINFEDDYGRESARAIYAFIRLLRGINGKELEEMKAEFNKKQPKNEKIDNNPGKTKNDNSPNHGRVYLIVDDKRRPKVIDGIDAISTYISMHPGCGQAYGIISKFIQGFPPGKLENLGIKLGMSVRRDEEHLIPSLQISFIEKHRETLPREPKELAAVVYTSKFENRAGEYVDNKRYYYTMFVPVIASYFKEVTGAIIHIAAGRTVGDSIEESKTQVLHDLAGRPAKQHKPEGLGCNPITLPFTVAAKWLGYVRRGNGPRPGAGNGPRHDGR